MLSDNSPGFISSAAAAVQLGVSLATVRRLVRTGRLPAVRVGGQLRIPADFAATLQPVVMPDRDREMVS